MQSDIVPDMARNPVVYILASHNRRALYIGVTTDLSRRLEEHHQGMVQLKNWRREKKLILINRLNPDWRDLSGEID
jgi:putative endonuclease